MDNKGVRFADYFNHFAEQNTTIVNCQLSIVHFARQCDKPEFEKICKNPCNSGELMVIYTKQLRAFGPAEEIKRNQGGIS